MNLIKCILTANRCYKTNQTIVPKGIMVHSTGANNTLLRRYVQPLSHNVPGAYDPDRGTLIEMLGVNPNNNAWNRNGIDACVHAFIGKLNDGSIAVAQTLPWDHRGWHAGDGTSGRSANDTHISFEICEDDLGSYNYFKQTKDAAVELTAMLCMQFNLNPLADGVVICHSEGYQRGIASGHSDVLHWWPKYGYTMDDFRKEIKNKIDEEVDDMTYYQTLEDVPSWYKPTIEKLVKDGVLEGTDDKGAINVSRDMCRIFTILDRMGKL